MDAKYPALLFKQQLTAYVEKIFGIIRDNLKKELTSLLSLCIQVSWILLAVFSSFSIMGILNHKVMERVVGEVFLFYFIFTSEVDSFI